MQLHNYFRSSASYRVRVALELKGLGYEYVPVHLVRGEQTRAPFADIAPTPLVPVLVDGGLTLSQSLAIIEYLDETHPEPLLLPGTAADRARIRSLAMDVACEIHPLNNLRVLRFLTQDLGVSEDAKMLWVRHWIEDGLAAVEHRLANDAATGRFCHGDTPTLADLTLVPQIFNARRFECELDTMPTLLRIYDNCLALDAFQRAQPSACSDAA
ncbi:MAG: maleylacetoacetate isomerase [Rhizobacter sp.]|jgi:maleylacetoacetate isomerase|nr:maleylacetoacetate isomerase [Rhizobacter sp.]